MVRFSLPGFRYLPYLAQEPSGSFSQVHKCFIRRSHSCGKYIGASKSCFIACPSSSDFALVTEIIHQKLNKIGVEPVQALKDRAYGEDIFCTKICGKIIESQFCIVVLDDFPEKVKGETVYVPNPNVYYEYGLMTALGKYVIPLQKEDQKLAFNIYTHDTIKYNNSNLSVELDRALMDAKKYIEEKKSANEGDDYLLESLFGRSVDTHGQARGTL
jgi:hypothetical protein